MCPAPQRGENEEVGGKWNLGSEKKNTNANLKVFQSVGEL